MYTMALHLGAPSPRYFILNKQEMCISPRLISYNSGNKPNVNHAHLIKLSKAAANKRLEHFGRKPAGKLDHENNINHVDLFSRRLLKGGLVFQQNFLIRSYELGPDCKISTKALVNLLQESSLNHLKGAGLVADGFGSTPEMNRRDLIWVIRNMQIAVDSYPSWDDVVQVETWVCASGRNGVRRDWLVRDYNTGKILLRALSVYVMLNKKTRKISKLIQEIREEIEAVFMDCDPIIEEDCRKLRDLDLDTADYIRTGLSTKWTDLDVNQHVNHIKYIDWILESIPESIVETHKVRAMRLEYQKECGKNSGLQSLCALAKQTQTGTETETDHDGVLELDHNLHLAENGSQILRARTVWMPRN